MLKLFPIVKFSMTLLYSFFKLFPTQKKVVFLSRQYNSPPIDFLMLEREIKHRNDSVKTVMIVERIEFSVAANSGLKVNKFDAGRRLLKNMLRSMYHVATSKVAILDTYSPVISLLNHKRSLKVIQIWHAMGKIKQSGYKNLDTEGGGRSSKVAKVMKMHEGYDLIVAGGKAWNRFYQESFNCSEDVLYNVGLPRIDYMIENWDEIRDKIYASHPLLQEKPTILYAPTWRKTDISGWDDFIKKFNFEKFNLVLKSHPNQELPTPDGMVERLPEFSTLECLAITDFLITDYSATAVEAAALNVKTFYYLYDFEIYSTKNGLNIDLFSEMPDCVFEKADVLLDALNDERYNDFAFNQYKAKFLPETIGHSTKLITDKIFEFLEGVVE